MDEDHEGQAQSDSQPKREHPRRIANGRRVDAARETPVGLPASARLDGLPTEKGSEGTQERVSRPTRWPCAPPTPFPPWHTRPRKSCACSCWQELRRLPVLPCR